MIRKNNFKRDLRFSVSAADGRRADKLDETNEQIFVTGLMTIEEAYRKAKEEAKKA